MKNSECFVWTKMWILLILVQLTISWTQAQNLRPPRQDGQDNGNGWDIRLAVPGEPGSDYPILGAIPKTSFSCSGKTPGYYADQEANCQVFRVCTLGATYGFQSFLCPNGTLFNQAVFVCDWWMNVNCQQSQQFINNDQFGNLRLGPQLMKDVKKMITHPMRNPLDQNQMKSNLVVMQNYIPPTGQFASGSLKAGGYRSPSNVYVPSKQIQLPHVTNTDSSFFASTPSPQYIPPSFNTIQTTSNTEVFQRQRQNGQYNRIPNTQKGNIISNGQAGRLTHFSAQNSNGFNQNTHNNQYYAQGNQIQNQRQSASPFITQNNLQKQNLQANERKQSEFNGYEKQQYNTNFQQRLNNYRTQVPQFFNNNLGTAGNEAKQNLVSNIPNGVIAKTLTYNRIIQEPKPGGPRSRITFKTWIIKPSKSAKIIADPTPYSYDKPTSAPAEKIIAESTAYRYDRPANSPARVVDSSAIRNNRLTNPSAKIIEPTSYKYDRPTNTPARIEDSTPYRYDRPTNLSAKIIEPKPYNYDRPTNPPARIIADTTPYKYERPTQQTSAKIVLEPTPYRYDKPTTPALAAKLIQQPYVYNKPSISAKQIITTPPQMYLPPTTPRPTLSGRLYLPPTTVAPTIPSRLFLEPTTFKPSAKLYLPPTQESILPPQQYLPSKTGSNLARLQASPSTTSPVIFAPMHVSPSFTLTKQSRVNTNHNNLTFSDILTKEKLDITVNDIVKDTSSVLNTASPEFGQLRQDDDYVSENYLPPNENSEETLTPQTPTNNFKSSKIIESPSKQLEPPVNNSDMLSFEENENQLANLPFFKEPSGPTNTIERTVSFKISIPERVAKYLFQSNNDSNFENLEILNTGSSNYLVLANKLSKNNIVPIGKIIVDNNSSFSNSQALVFSFLADSINVAKEYNNLAQQHVLTSAQPQMQTSNNADLSDITNKVSQLTSSQYSGNTNANAKLISSDQSNYLNQQKEKTMYAQNFMQNQKYPSQNAQYYSNKYSSPSQNNPQSNNNQIVNMYQQQVNRNPQQVYSGQLYQLPVPDVSHIYSGQNNDNVHHSEIGDLQNNDNGIAPGNNKPNTEVEIIPSQVIPISSPAKLQAAPEDTESFNSQENAGENSLSNFGGEEGISAHIKDNIIGVIPHPIDTNKLVTYKKDQSYYIFSKLSNNDYRGNVQTNNFKSTAGPQSARLVQSDDNHNNQVSFQFIPSVSYQLDDEKEQENILNTFNIDEFGSPKEVSKNDGYQIQNPNEKQIYQGANVDYSVNHDQPTPNAQRSGQLNQANTLYSGLSSYLAPQASVGKLQNSQQAVNNNNYNSRLEQLENGNNQSQNNGYSNTVPSQQFQF